MFLFFLIFEWHFQSSFKTRYVSKQLQTKCKTCFGGPWMLQKHFSKNRGLVFSYPSWPPQFSETLSFLRIFSLLPSLSCSMKFVCSLPMLKFVCYARVLHRFTMSKFCAWFHIVCHKYASLLSTLCLTLLLCIISTCHNMIWDLTIFHFLDTQVSLAPTHVSP